MRPKYLLGIDNGGTMSKAALYNLEGREIAVSSRKTGLIMPEPGYTERDMNELWEANAQVIRETIMKSGVDPEDIVGVATTGHGNGVYWVDENGAPVYNGIISTDNRAKEYVTKWYNDGTFERIFPKTMQSIWPGQPVAILAWFRDHQPQVIEKTKWIFMCKDYIRYCLTGEAYAEVTDFSGTHLMNIDTIKYDRDLLREFGLENVAAKLPPLKYSSEICGYISKQAARMTGLKEGTPVAGGLFDIDASGIATGITDSEKLCVIVGTWGIHQYISKTPVSSKDIFMTSLYCMKGYWLIMEGSPTSASNLEWFITKLMGEEQRIAAEKGISVYDICEEMIRDVKPEDHSILFLPFLFGSNVDLDAQSCFIGLNGYHDKKQILRAVYEGIAFSHYYHINKLLALREPPDCVRISGGGCHSKTWVQIFADVFQMPIEVACGTEFGTLGAAICAGVGTGYFDSFENAAQKLVDIAYRCQPNPAMKEVYQKKYQNYLKAIELLSPLWKDL